jgi:hypothetical protein
LANRISKFKVVPYRDGENIEQNADIQLAEKYLIGIQKLAF